MKSMWNLTPLQIGKRVNVKKKKKDSKTHHCSADIKLLFCHMLVLRFVYCIEA